MSWRWNPCKCKARFSVFYPHLFVIEILNSLWIVFNSDRRNIMSLIYSLCNLMSYLMLFSLIDSFHWRCLCDYFLIFQHYGKSRSCNIHVYDEIVSLLATYSYNRYQFIQYSLLRRRQIMIFTHFAKGTSKNLLLFLFCLFVYMFNNLRNNISLYKWQCYLYPFF
jgi:hypothetical protein